jgi:hypothetical protein
MHARLVPSDAKVDGRFGKGVVEVVGPDQQARQRQGRADQDEADVTTFEALFNVCVRVLALRAGAADIVDEPRGCARMHQPFVPGDSP